ncbi:DUF2147 domain-containing protein [Maliponia aquimaris]|uniref:DUF2147 domain-containing protein n=1 Tax=Maliponia aquimaris TaxID=1673631 RepID=A0A238L3Y6_9RHOB|nr:DUF2147 domain-containing protein [Maliponia aquimaris]SMX49570.1 hypothetical protein MAA8898_04351 [Maliponia aquimaris]
MKRFLLLPLMFVVGFAMSAAAADPMVGLWKTPPDRKNLSSHIRVDPCGVALCGTVFKAFDPQGREVKTPNVGKLLFWDLKPSGGGAYGGGKVRVPLLNVTASAKAQLTGNSLRVTGCKAGVCDGQTWARLN